MLRPAASAVPRDRAPERREPMSLRGRFPRAPSLAANSYTGSGRSRRRRPPVLLRLPPAPRPVAPPPPVPSALALKRRRRSAGVKPTALRSRSCIRSPLDFLSRASNSAVSAFSAPPPLLPTPVFRSGDPGNKCFNALVFKSSAFLSGRGILEPAERTKSDHKSGSSVVKMDSTSFVEAKGHKRTEY